jgi:hypothetical protein
MEGGRNNQNALQIGLRDEPKNKTMLNLSSAFRDSSANIQDVSPKTNSFGNMMGNTGNSMIKINIKKSP